MVKLTQEQIDDLKKKHGESLHVIEIIEDDGSTCEVYAKKPDRATYFRAYATIDSQPEAAAAALVGNCIVDDGQKEAVKANDDFYFTCFNALSRLMKSKPFTVKNALTPPQESEVERQTDGEGGTPS